VDTRRREAIGALWPDAGRPEAAAHAPVRPETRSFEEEQVLHCDDISLHSSQLGDACHFARAVRQSGYLHDQIHCRGNLLANCSLWDIQVRHRDHRVQTIQGIAGAVGVNSRQASIVTGIHRLKHVERFLTTDLANHNAIRSHTQRVDDEIALAHCPFTFNICRTRLQSDDVSLAQLQFRGIFNRDHPLVVVDEARQDIEQGRLSGARAS
jgi:hypothetical protein